MKLVRLKKREEASYQLVSNFVRNAGRSLQHFRYFAERTVNVIDAHLATLLLLENGEPVGYGHLDPEGSRVWLGLAVKDSHRRRGIGRRMLASLLKTAREEGIETVSLTVDVDNAAARALYSEAGFVEDGLVKADILLMKKSLINIYISTLAFSEPLGQVIQYAAEQQLKIEFTSGGIVGPDAEAIYRSATIERMPHNYFPPPAQAFVLNLGSLREDIRERSIAHCKQGIRLAKAAKAPFYAAHAGFCIDPKPEELGRKLERPRQVNREENWNRFVDAVCLLADYASKQEQVFLVENNVIARFNLLENGTNPLLCCDAAELRALAEAVNQPGFGILLDTAHLKVSANTLGNDPAKEVEVLAPFVKGVHHSDNDGERDTNEPLTQGYWFRPHLARFRDLPHVLEVRAENRAAVINQKRLLVSFFENA